MKKLLALIVFVAMLTVVPVVAIDMNAGIDTTDVGPPQEVVLVMDYTYFSASSNLPIFVTGTSSPDATTYTTVELLLEMTFSGCAGVVNSNNADFTVVATLSQLQEVLATGDEVAGALTTHIVAERHAMSDYAGILPEIVDLRRKVVWADLRALNVPEDSPSISFTDHYTLIA